MAKFEDHFPNWKREYDIDAIFEDIARHGNLNNKMPQKERILVTGGAGFIGSFLTDELIKSGYRVRIFDNLEEQVHHGRKPPI